LNEAVYRLAGSETGAPFAWFMVREQVQTEQGTFHEPETRAPGQENLVLQLGPLRGLFELALGGPALHYYIDFIACFRAGNLFGTRL